MLSVGVACAGCGGQTVPGPTGSPPGSAASQTTASSVATSTTACTLATTFDYVERTAETGQSPTAEEIGNVDLAPSLQEFQATHRQHRHRGECTEIALASDNPGYDVNATYLPPLKKVIDRTRPGC